MFRCVGMLHFWHRTSVFHKHILHFIMFIFLNRSLLLYIHKAEIDLFYEKH